MTDKPITIAYMTIYRTADRQRWLLHFQDGTHHPPTVELSNADAAWLARTLTEEAGDTPAPPRPAGKS